MISLLMIITSLIMNREYYNTLEYSKADKCFCDLAKIYIFKSILILMFINHQLDVESH